MYYYFSQPPFLVLIIGVAIALTCTTAFKTQVEQKIQMSKDSETSEPYRLEGTGILVSYWGICLGIWVFLAGGLLIFGFGVISSYGVSLLLTIFTGSIIWNQLDELLLEYQQGGSKALDLDELDK